MGGEANTLGTGPTASQARHSTSQSEYRGPHESTRYWSTGCLTHPECSSAP